MKHNGTPAAGVTTSFFGRRLSRLACSLHRRRRCPSRTFRRRGRAVGQPGVAEVVTKNCDPFVFGPALAMAKTRWTVNRCELSSRSCDRRWNTRPSRSARSKSPPRIKFVVSPCGTRTRASAREFERRTSAVKFATSSGARAPSASPCVSTRRFVPNGHVEVPLSVPIYSHKFGNAKATSLAVAVALAPHNAFVFAPSATSHRHRALRRRRRRPHCRDFSCSRRRRRRRQQHLTPASSSSSSPVVAQQTLLFLLRLLLLYLVLLSFSKPTALRASLSAKRVVCRAPPPPRRLGATSGRRRRRNNKRDDDDTATAHAFGERSDLPSRRWPAVSSSR